jgi:hypothetical protein
MPFGVTSFDSALLYVESAAFAAAYAIVDSGSGSWCWIDVT